MVKSLTDQTVSASFTQATGTANTAISAIVHFIHVETQQPEGNGSRAKVFGTVQTATGYMKRKQLNT